VLKAFALVIVIALVATACGGSNSQQTSTANGAAFTVAVGKDAASAARQEGVDLKALVARSAEKAFSLLPHRGVVRIDVRLNASKTIRQIGVGGFTDPRSGNVSIWIERRPPGGLRRALETWLPGSVAHELHHSSRIRTGPGYGNTLAEALVSEGLADHFTEEAFPKTPPQPWDHSLTKAQEKSLWRAARGVLDIPDGYDHEAWFVGGGNAPRWAGYSLAYDIVGAYLDHHRSASEAVAVDAGDVIGTFRGF
jgi:hypothetical protein